MVQQHSLTPNDATKQNFYLIKKKKEPLAFFFIDPAPLPWSPAAATGPLAAGLVLFYIYTRVFAGPS